MQHWFCQLAQNSLALAPGHQVILIVESCLKYSEALHNVYVHVHLIDSQRKFEYLYFNDRLGQQTIRPGFIVRFDFSDSAFQYCISYKLKKMKLNYSSADLLYYWVAFYVLC